MTKTADWISRRAGFGFSLSDDPISQSQWFTRARQSISKPRSYTSNHRIKPLLESAGKGLSEADKKTYSGITLGLKAGIVHRAQLWREEKRLLQENKNLQQLMIDKSIRPVWLSTYRRADFCVNTEADFANRLWLFWLNYFTVSESMNNLPCLPNFQEMVRTNMFGAMSDLVFKVVTHPAMILYLDNQDNTGENSRASKEKWTDNGTNENLARETLELYTVTPSNGYSQDDVNGMTNILTGWKLVDWDNINELRFEKDYHEPGTQTVLGKKYNSSTGKGQLKRVLRDLTSMQDTAKHLAFRLCQHFIADHPEPDHVNQLATIYRKNKGQLAPVYLGLLDILEELEQTGDKFLNPEVWLYHTLKTFDIDVPNGVPRNWNFNPNGIASILRELGLLHGEAQQPNGWPEVEQSWLSNEYLDRRLRLASIIGRNYSYTSVTTEAVKNHGLDVEQLQRFNLSPHTQNVILGSQQPIQQIAALLCSPGFLRS
ncbi:MAG: DUF1800 family protein [Oceanospirillaceae bacterium]|jgi:uncharacterized protein (DUF1800 family)|nr:DUF1800 family protein [Oceanospirillaceae bacterium]